MKSPRGAGQPELVNPVPGHTRSAHGDCHGSGGREGRPEGQEEGGGTEAQCAAETEERGAGAGHDLRPPAAAVAPGHVIYPGGGGGWARRDLQSLALR